MEYNVQGLTTAWHRLAVCCFSLRARLEPGPHHGCGGGASPPVPAHAIGLSGSDSHTAGTAAASLHTRPAADTRDQGQHLVGEVPKQSQMRKGS